MPSSVSYVCLGGCAGMWVISRGIYLGVLVLSFISVLLFQRSGHFCLFLTFATFLRFDELAKLVRSDVKIENDMLKLFIQSSKTDQYRDGAWIVVASSRKATCPVAMMNRYLDRAGLSCDSPLFCQLSKTKCGYKLRSKG